MNSLITSGFTKRETQPGNVRSFSPRKRNTWYSKHISMLSLKTVDFIKYAVSNSGDSLSQYKETSFSIQKLHTATS